MNDISDNNKCTQCDAEGFFGSMYWLHDARGIPVAKVCPKCEAQVKRRYKPWVWTGYSELDCGEPIEPEY